MRLVSPIGVAVGGSVRKRTASIKHLDPSWTPHYANIVGYWKMDGTIGNIANGATVPATVGPNITAASTSFFSLAYVSGSPFGSAIDFDGSFGAVNIPTSLDSGQLTVNVWASWATYLSGDPQGIASSTGGDWFININGAGFIEFGDINGDFFVVSNTSIGDSAYHMITCTFDTANNGHVTISIDSLLDVSIDTFAGMSLTGANYLLGYSASNGAYWTGKLSQFSVWQNDVLDSIDISSLYNGGSGRPDIVHWVPPDTPGAVLNYCLPLTGSPANISSGDLIPQISGPAPNGTAIGKEPMSYQAGKVGNAINGGNNVGSSFSTAGFPIGTTSSSIVFWINTTQGTSDNYHGIFEYGVNASNTAFAIFLDADFDSSSVGPNTLAFGFGGGAATISTNSPVVNDGTWHHVAATWNGTTAVIYIDGVSIVSGNIAINIPAPSFSLFGSNFYGLIDEMALFSGVALSGAEVATIYNHQL